MGPFTRVDARDLAIALALSAVWFGLLSLFPSRNTSIWTALGMAAFWFLMLAPTQAPASTSRPLGDRRTRDRVGRELRGGRVPDGVDRLAWLEHLALIPNTAPLRRRTRWVLTSCGVGALVGVAAVIAALLLDGSDLWAISEPFVITIPTAMIGVGAVQVIPWATKRSVATMRRTLQEAP